MRRETNVGRLTEFLDELARRVPQDYSVRATPIFNQEWLVIIESATQKDQYYVDMETETWVRYV